MRCEDCLPLIEEYFDGEVVGQAAEAVSAHLAVCADCAAAYDALSFEQEIYARYDRGGLEVTPDLWARVSAEIAREVPPQSPAARRPFLSRARASFAAALGALAVRPALASSLALLVVAAAAGTLWLARRPQPEAPAQDVARQQTPVAPVAVIPQAPAAGGDNAAPPSTNLSNINEGELSSGADEPRGARGAEVAVNVRPAEREVSALIDVARLLDEPSEAKDDPSLVKFRTEERPADDTERLLADAAAPRRELVTTEARLLDPEEKDVARHVERAQMLLRSIKNARTSDAGDADLAYEKDLSRKLLAENATLQLEAEVSGDKGTQQVLDRIEPFLLEIANMGEKPSREEVRSIGERVRQNEIVAALEVY